MFVQILSGTHVSLQMARMFVVTNGMFLGMVWGMNDMHMPLLYHPVSRENIGASANALKTLHLWKPINEYLSYCS